MVSFSSIYAYSGKSSIVGYQLTQMVWYFACLSIIWQSIWNGVDSNISQRILSGSMAVDLLRPLSIFKFELAQAISGRILAVGLQTLPCLVLYAMLCYPSFLTLVSSLEFIIVLVMAFILYFLINYLIGLSSFFIKSNLSLQGMRNIIVILTSGGGIPLDFYPKWFLQINCYLPFQYIFYWPIQIFLNWESARGLAPFLRVIANQLGWSLSLFLIAHLLWKQAIKRFCAVGG
jgi:ABC-2 type transport system permease protein